MKTPQYFSQIVSIALLLTTVGCSEEEAAAPAASPIADALLSPAKQKREFLSHAVAAAEESAADLAARGEDDDAELVRAKARELRIDLEALDE